MIENNNQNSAEEQAATTQEVKKDIQGLIGSSKKFLYELLNIRTDTDQEATKASIIADIPFKGHTSWILICSIFIASVGLNANSTAVVIGAMLISPLMGPILGLGMSLAINDIDTLKRSVKNLVVMVVLSVLTAYLFFALFPLRDESSELLARIKPDIRDVLIAFFGGLALVIARTKKGTIASVIFGVAIATALMPPLCTVGFGLAIGNWNYAGGAMLLFSINTIYIALATFIVIKYLRFPMVRYANSQRRRLISRLVSLVALSVMIPSGYIFYKVYQESVFEQKANEFINDNVAPYKFSDEGRFLEDFTDIEYNAGKNSLIELVFMGNEIIPESVINTWMSQKNEYEKLKDAELKIVQGASNDEVDQLKYVDELYQKNKAEMLNKDEKIKLLEEEVATLNKNASKQIPFSLISTETKAIYENMEAMGFSYKIQTDFKKVDTIPVFEIKWKKGMKPNQVKADSKKLENWLKIRLKDTLVTVEEFKN